MASVVKELFRGSQKWVTKCRNCPYESGREQPFDEIELSLEGHDSVKSCLKVCHAREVIAVRNTHWGICATESGLPNKAKRKN